MIQANDRKGRKAALRYGREMLTAVARKPISGKKGSASIDGQKTLSRFADQPMVFQSSWTVRG